MPKPSPKIPLPKGWPASAKSGVLHVIALAQFAMTYARGWAADSVIRQAFYNNPPVEG